MSANFLVFLQLVHKRSLSHISWIQIQISPRWYGLLTLHTPATLILRAIMCHSS